MAVKPDNGRITIVKEPYGGSTVEERKAAMSRGLTSEDIARRNVIPTTAPNGEPHRVIAEELYSENDTFTHYKPAVPDAPGPASFRTFKPAVRDEAQKITDRIGVKVTKDDPDYWGLASVMTEEEAGITRHMKVRKPMTFTQLQQTCGVEPDHLQQLLDDMCVKGIIEYNWENLDGKNPSHEKRYVLPMFVPGSAEFTVMNQAQVEEHPEIGTFFERMTFLPLAKVTKMVPPGGAGIGMHVIPVERAIEQVNEAADVEKLSHWLKKYDRFSVGACSCRISERARGDNAGSDPQNWCVGVGDMADYCVETGKGHFATYDEVVNLLLLAEKNGYVHQITNIDGSDKIFAICNCDVNICYALRTSQLFNTPNMSRSAYVAHIQADKCVACAGCVEACPAGAVQLGQKLPTVNGAVEYPRQPLPTLKWSEADWDPAYKDNNRIECHDTGTAPCKVACPAHISVQGYLRMAAEGRYRDALALIKKENPFPAVCGRVCNRRCEAACTRGTVDEAVAIDEVKKFIAEKDLQAEHRYVPEVTPPTTRGGFREKIAVVGAGPAGLSCAYYLATLGYAPVVFERDEKPGGMMTYGIPSYKLAKDVVDAEIDVLREMGVEIRCGVEVGRDVTLAELREQGFAAFYLAIGCQGGRRAGVPGEDAEGVTTAVEFLRTAIGASHPAPGEANGAPHPVILSGARSAESKDLQPYDGEGPSPSAQDDNGLAQNDNGGQGRRFSVAGKTVVIGGGNVAIDAARVSVRCGASDVAMYCLEQPDEMPALPEEIAEAREDGVSIQNGWGPARIEVGADGRVEGVTFKRCTRVFDADGRFAPEYEEADTVTVACDNVVLAIGQSIEWGNLLEGSAVKLGRGNGAVADPKTYQTDEPDIFVGGDVFTGPRFVIDAIAAGHEAAISLHRYVQKGSSLTLGRNPRHYVELDKETVALNPLSYDHAGRGVPACAQPASVLHNWDDVRATFTEEQIRVETARCLSCGASIVDPYKCIGCGLCTTRCEFDAIHLNRDNPECSTMARTEDKLKKILPNAGSMLLGRLGRRR